MQAQLQFPLNLEFKRLAVAPQITVTDANGQVLCFVRQKIMALKEVIMVHTDSSQTQELYQINADRVLDFSAKYYFRDVNGHSAGHIQRDGIPSLWEARYHIYNEYGQPVIEIREKDPWVKVMDRLFGELPVVGILSGYVFNPTYLMHWADGTTQVEVVKKPSFMESNFSITPHGQVSPQDYEKIILGVIMMVLLERSRG